MGKRGKSRGQFIAGAALVLLVIFTSVSVFTYKLYQSIVDESKTLAWEMTQKSAQAMDLQLENIQSSLAAFARSISVGGLEVDEVHKAAYYEVETLPVLRLVMVTESGELVTGSETAAIQEYEQLGARCPVDGVFSDSYVGMSGRWQTAVVNIKQQFTGYTQTVVDLEAIIHMRIVNQPFPAHRGTRLFKIDAHYDFQLIFQLFTQRQQASGILFCRDRIMN